MDEGISCSALREVKLLRELQGEGGCPNVIQLLDVFCHKHKLLMVRVHGQRPGRPHQVRACDVAESNIHTYEGLKFEHDI